MTLGDGAIAQLDLSARDGKRESVPVDRFAHELRLFCAKDGKLSLVRFVGEGGMPEPASGERKEGGKRHRDNWETVLADVTQVVLTPPAGH